MKNWFKLFKIIAFIALISLVIIACDLNGGGNGGNGGNGGQQLSSTDLYGTWEHPLLGLIIKITSTTIRFENKNEAGYGELENITFILENNLSTVTKDVYPKGYKITGTISVNKYFPFGSNEGDTFSLSLYFSRFDKNNVCRDGWDDMIFIKQLP